MSKKLKVVELFAWVWWFRVWLEKTGKYEIVWSNQWEPSTKTQHASMVYENVFWSKNHSNENIEKVPTTSIPDHDMLVWGFPCQDYSVASTLQNAKWLIWKKWVLWWSIYRILSEKKNKPKYLILENVDRLLNSPVKQRGRDFAIMLKSLSDLGYAVEWRVINAAEYWMPQRRKRIFIIWYYKGTPWYENIKKNFWIEWIKGQSTITKAFPINDTFEKENSFEIEWDLQYVSDNFPPSNKTIFENTGVYIDSKVFTAKTTPNYNWDRTLLWDILEKKVSDEFYIDKESNDKWEYLKWAKKETRVTADGFEYNYSEWWMIFPDDLNKPSRTIITGEWWKSPSRFKHVVKTDKWLRRLTPLELERLNMFPDNHTKLEWITDTKRAFFMGNALVVGVIEKLGESLYKNT